MTLTNDVLNTDFVDAVQDRINTDCTYGAIGTGTAEESASGTALGNEYLRKARQETTTDATSRTVSLWVGSTQGNGSDVGEVGFFNAASDGSMKVRHKLASTITKTSDIELWFDVKTTIACTQT